MEYQGRQKLMRQKKCGICKKPIEIDWNPCSNRGFINCKNCQYYARINPNIKNLGLQFERIKNEEYFWGDKLNRK